MLPKQNRLSKREDFEKTFSRGIYIQIQEGIAIKFLKTDLEFSRLGFPIGKNFSKRAVDRNRAKRILKNASYPLLNELKDGFDIIILIRPGKKDFQFKQISDQLKKVFAKANLLT